MALKGISGSLASLDLLEAAGGCQAGDNTGRLRAVLAGARRELGPTSSARQIVDVLVLPFARELGLEPALVLDDGDVLSLSISTGGCVLATLSAGGWNADLRHLRQMMARGAPRWWIGANGATLRVMDVSRAYTQRAIDFDLDRVEEDDRALRVLQRVFTSPFATLEALIRNTELHRSTVGRRRPVVLDAALADALTIVYRILFLLFAEARGLVPQWHPVYRDSYTIESLRPVAEGPAPPAGLWQALQAIARLAHRGCTAGTLRVVPFNGRLFAPSAAPLADSFVLDDRVARDVLLAVTTRPGADRRERITYADLGVEQLGAVYERVLDYAPSAADGTVTLIPSGRRKDTGTFYTPRAMTEYLVRRTLAPLVRGRAPEAVLSLRVVDPAMGSGAFLVAACRGGSGRLPPGRRPAMRVRRRSQPDGGPARPPVAVVMHPGSRSAAHVSRSSLARGKHPGRRARNRRHAPAARPGPAPPAFSAAVVRGRRPHDPPRVDGLAAPDAGPAA